MTATHPFRFDGVAEIIGHRGFSARAPENTLAALELALDAGADAVEFDLHIAGDGTAVLLHDVTLDRTTTGSGDISEWSAADLADLDAGSWFAPEFSGEPLPTLTAALTHIAGRTAHIYAEVKGYRTLEDMETILRVVTEAGASEQTIFISMDWRALDRIRQGAREALIGYIVEAPDRAAAAIDRAKGDPRALLDFDANVLLEQPDLAATARDAGIAMAAWTVDTAERASALLEMGVPRIATNEVSTLAQWRASL